MSLPEKRFEQLRSREGIQALLGQTEDLYLDCKEWPNRDDDAQSMLAKALSGFSNADGGVLAIGLEAKSSGKDEPDVIQRLKPVTDAKAVRSKIENLIGNLIEPPLQGVQVAEVIDVEGQPPGFVLVYVPPTDGLPTRSRKHWNFYLRVGAGTFPMEYFQLADMFGRRSRPVLSLSVAMGRITSDQGGPVFEREFVLGIHNSGRGIARFPSIRFKTQPGINLSLYGLDGKGKSGLPLRPTSPSWMVFGGGADDVIYPGTNLEVAKLTHRSRASEWRRAGASSPAQYFPKVEFTAELAADEVPSTTVQYDLPMDESL